MGINALVNATRKSIFNMSSNDQPQQQKQHRQNLHDAKDWEGKKSRKKTGL